MKNTVILVIFIAIGGISTFANAEMVGNDTIGNDKAKEKLCASRVTFKGKPIPLIPFEIDSKYLERSRSNHPDATFIAVDGDSPQLIECYLREGTGKYEPASYSPQQWYWRTIQPKRFEPSIKTPEGESIAYGACEKKFREKYDRPNFDHNIGFFISEVGINAEKPVSGKKPMRYDVIVDGTAFYKSSKPNNPDLDSFKYRCLFSPMLEFKAIQLTK